MRVLPSLLLLAVVVACDRPGPDDSGDTVTDTNARAVYTREMFFVADDATGAALLDFSATDVGSAIRRSARAWAEAGSGWVPLYDLAWQGTPVRRPWRLVPRGPLRLRVGDRDEIEAIAVREEETDNALLETGDFIAEWSPGATTQIVLREATLALGGEPMRGWLVDARFGVTRQAADDTTGGYAPNGPPAPAITPAVDRARGQDSAAVAAPDSAVGPPAVQRPEGTLRVRSVRGVLVGPDGATLIVVETSNGLAGWLWSDGAETTLPDATLTRAAGERETWSFEGGGGALTASLQVMDEDPLPVSPRIVRGTVRFGADTLDVHGVLRPADPPN